MLDLGGVIVEILMTGDLAAWANTYDLNVTTVSPKDSQTYNLLGIRETAFIVDLRTMQIVWKYNGSIFGIGDSSAKVAIAQILTML